MLCSDRRLLWYSLLSGENIPLVIVFCQNWTFIWWLSFVRTEHTFGDCLLSEQNLSVEYSFGIVFCQNRTFFWYCFLLEQNIPLVLSSVRTEHAFGIVFWQNRTFLWWLSSVRIEWAFGIVFYQNIAVFWWSVTVWGKLLKGCLESTVLYDGISVKVQ
jgi:hypothetical protein